MSPLAPRPARPGWPLPRWLAWSLCALVVLGGLGLEVARRHHLNGLVRPGAADPLRPRPDSFYRVQWGGVQLPSALAAGGTVRVMVTLRNAGTETWPDPPMADPEQHAGAGAIRLSYRWWRTDVDALVGDYSARFNLFYPVSPGDTISMPLDVRLPPEQGRYRLQVDLVQELVSWFEPRGADRLLVPVIVGPP